MEIPRNTRRGSAERKHRYFQKAQIKTRPTHPASLKNLFRARRKVQNPVLGRVREGGFVGVVGVFNVSPSCEEIFRRFRVRWMRVDVLYQKMPSFAFCGTKIFLHRNPSYFLGSGNVGNGNVPLVSRNVPPNRKFSDS